jgi:hypothetical protein
MVDSETGEKLSFTKAKWTSKEGRLSLNARTILNMGTGRLDLRSLSHSNSVEPSGKSSGFDQPQNPVQHELVTEFLKNGPLTPYMHVRWNPRNNTIDYPGLDLLDGADLTISDDSSRSIVLATSSSDMATNIDSFSIDYMEEQWARLHSKTFQELFDVAEKMEHNKSLTGEARWIGGLPAMRKKCWELAMLKVQQRRELVRAVEDERQRENKREIAERENCAEPEVLKELQKMHGVDRRKGRTYLQHLQRDQEIIFMRRMHNEGLLW